MQQENNPTQGLGIAGLILGILSIVFAIIPCTLLLALVLSIIGLILSIIGINKANQLQVDKSLLIAGLITSIIGLSIAGLWGLAFKKMFDMNETIHREYYEINQNTDDVEEGNTVDFDSLVRENDKTMDELEEYMDEIESKPEAAKPVDNKAKK
ncbi:MAG: hypothetical protein L3J74_07475 [Bacteroidales bacterium]|nr:hypothetical protein [Bacteroidales bacterium]